MPRYTPDPTKNQGGFPVLPKGLYRLEISNASSFETKPDPSKGQNGNYGVRYATKVVASEDQPSWVGKSAGPLNLYFHTEGAQNFSKSIYMRVVGCETDEEFDSKFASEDFSFNPDDKSVGQFWHNLNGKLVDVMVGEPEEGKNRDGSANGKLQTKIESYLISR